MTQWLSSSPHETQNIGGLLASFARPGDVITLSGDLGMGKTTLARGLIQALVPNLESVQSPTFNIVHVYDAVLVDGSHCPLWHVDLYRLKSAEELTTLGLEDALGHAVVVIEWPKLATQLLPKDVLQLELKATDAADTREIFARGETFLKRMQ